VHPWACYAMNDDLGLQVATLDEKAKTNAS
jgi:hypothetical protein